MQPIAPKLDAHLRTATFTLHGIAVARGVAIGRAWLLTPALIDVPHLDLQPEAIAAEIDRFENAVALVHDELMGLIANLDHEHVPTELSALLDVHLLFLTDPHLSDDVKSLIQTRQCNAEWALVTQLEHIVAQFEAFEDDYLRERKQDVQQVVERVLKVLMGTSHRLADISHDHDAELLVVAHDIAPADMLYLKDRQFAGFVTDLGSQTSHTAILGRSLGIPAVVGLLNAHQLIQQNEWLIVDGEAGVIIVNPPTAVLQEYRLRQSELQLERDKLRRLCGKTCMTLDETSIELMANIELPTDATKALEADAVGVGLFRTEFLFMNRATSPTEEEQFEAYREVATTLKGLPVTIRTLDIGADKVLDHAEQVAVNPALGLRAIRYCLSEPTLFLTQLRAILRASHYGNIKLLIPMVAHYYEIEQTLHYIAEAKQDLQQRNQPFNANIEIGAMIEIPAAAILASFFAQKFDFFSIGTNDLIQYTLAIDRTDNEVAHLYDPLHPAILKLISQTIDAAKKANIPVSVCGEMAGDVTLTRLLIGLGLRCFSMHPSQILSIKQQVLLSQTTVAEQQSKKILKTADPVKIRTLLDDLNHVHD
jgi:phosphotransferase system enzyme I (PtsI)